MRALAPETLWVLDGALYVACCFLWDLLASPFCSFEGFAAVLELAMGPSSLEVDAKKVDDRTLFTVWIQYMRARHPIDLAEPNLYSIAHGIGVSYGGELDRLAEELRVEWAGVGGYVPVAGAGAAVAAAAGPVHPQPLPEANPGPAVASSASASPPASVTRRQAAAARAAGPWPLNLNGGPGFSSIVRVGVPNNRPSADPCLLCPICVARDHDKDYKISLSADGSIPTKQLLGTASTSRRDVPCIRTFIDVASASSEDEALSEKPTPPEPPSRETCTTRYSSAVSAPGPPSSGAGGTQAPTIQVIIAAGCLHGISIMNGIVAGLSPENYWYYYRIFSGACGFSPLQIETLWGDMFCQLGPQLLKRSLHPAFPGSVKFKVPPFHAEGHTPACFVSNSAQMNKGGGWETTEWEEEWAAFQLRVGRSLPYMSSDRWKDVTQLCFFQMASEKRCSIFELLASRQRRMLKQDEYLSSRIALLLSEAMSLLESHDRLAGAVGVGAGAPQDAIPGRPAMRTWALVTGAGAQRLTGPRIPSLSRAKTMPAAASDRDTQDSACWPDPTRLGRAIYRGLDRG